MSATRRLDDVYYSILEKISNLRNTISSLQELSTLTRDLHHDFIEESHELTDDIEGQIDTFGDFEGQKQKVDDLEKRIQKGRERAQGLDKRLARCRERVTWVEKKDAEEADKAGRFYKMLWSALGILVAILLTILIVHHLKAPLRTVGSTIERPSHTMNLSHVSMPPPVKEMLESVKEEKTRSYMKQTSPAYQKAKLEEEDERLRVFNEL